MDFDGCVIGTHFYIGLQSFVGFQRFGLALKRFENILLGMQRELLVWWTLRWGLGWRLGHLFLFLFLFPY